MLCLSVQVEPSFRVGLGTYNLKIARKKAHERPWSAQSGAVPLSTRGTALRLAAGAARPVPQPLVIGFNALCVGAVCPAGF